MQSTTTNALEILRMQHDDVEEMIETIEDSEDPREKEMLFAILADNLAAHATIEEKLFYPAVMTLQTHEQLIEATEEHLAVKRLIADMLSSGDDEHFAAKLSVIKENLRHHAHDEEEDKLFPIVEKMLNEDELAALGNELIAMFEMLMEQEPGRNVPTEIGEAARLRM